MTIETKKEFDPLTRSWGFIATIPGVDAAFAFTERDAVAKLINRYNQEFAVEWSNGSTTIHKAIEQAVPTIH